MAESWIVVQGGVVIDGTGNPPTEPADVVIRNDRIVSVGGEFDPALAPSDGVRFIDARGMTVMPGLIDVHCHMTYGEAKTEEEIDLYTSHELRTIIAAANAEKVLRAGVTSISQPGGSYYIGVGVREAIKRGLVKGPRMTAAGRYLTTSNGLTDWYPSSVGVPDGNIGILTNTVDEMKAEVRKQVKNGVDLVKLADSPYGQYQAFTSDEMKQVADLVHQLGKKCTIHARGSAELDAAVKAGFDWIMHGNVMTDEVIEGLAESQTTLAPVLLLLANICDWPQLTGATPKDVDGMRRMLEKTADTLHRAHAAGVRFAVGTDTGFGVTPYGEWHARELELLCIYAGLTPLEAITAGTCNGAEMMGLAGELGQLTPGYLADLLVVRGDPLTNLRVLLNKTNLVHVIKNGEVQEFDEELDHHRFQFDRQPVVYSQVDLTYEMVCDGEPSPSYVVAPWSAGDAKDLARDIGVLQHAVGPTD
ncbi:MAG TPA: amidohydrolase family protein [Acidimicrobiales bacterium]|nr:amidohydrolase family protein [Acidimicrobiales bacterium]